MTKEELEKLREEAFWRGDINKVNKINKQLNIKSKPVNEDAIYNLGFLPEYTITAADPNRPTAPKNVVKTFAYSPINLSKTLAQGAEQGYTWAKNNPKEAAEMALDFTPVVGDVKGLTYDVYQGAKQGGWQGGATAASLGLLGLIPGLGDVASKGIKTSIKETLKAPYQKIKNSTLARDWKNSKKDINDKNLRLIAGTVPFSQLYLSFPERNFSDRLAYMAFVPRSNKNAVNAYVNLITSPEVASLRKKWKKLHEKETNMLLGVTSPDFVLKPFQKTLANFLTDLSSNLGGVQYNLKLAPLELKYAIKMTPWGEGFSFDLARARAQRIPLAFDPTPLKNYMRLMQDELEDFGYVGGSTRLLDHYNLPDVPGDLEIITTQDRLLELLKKFPDLSKGRYKLDNDLLKTFGFNSSKGINNEIDADIILQDAQGKAKGRMAHLIWSATQPEEYRKWLHSLLTDNPLASLDNISLPLSAEEIYLLGKKNPEKVVLYDLLKSRGKGRGVLKKNQRNWDLMHPEHLPAVREATENIIRTYMPNYKSFKDQFPDFDYSNIDANKQLVSRLGYDLKIAEDPLLMGHLMEILNANALKGRQADTRNLLNGATMEEALRSLWAPQGGWVSGAGGNTIATHTGAEGYGDFLGILLNDRSKDFIKDSKDYIQAFDRELYRNKIGDIDYPLPDGLSEDLKNLGIEAKTISELNPKLHIDPASPLGKKVYPLLNKYGIRNINSTGNFSNVGDGAFYSGNVDTDVLLSKYSTQNLPYIELPHSHGMYDDAYSRSDKVIYPESEEEKLFYERRKMLLNSMKKMSNTRQRLSKKDRELIAKEGFNQYDLNYSLPLIKNKKKEDAIRLAKNVGLLGTIFGAPTLGGAAVARMNSNALEQNEDDQLAWLTKDSKNPYQPIEPSIFLSPTVLAKHRNNYIFSNPEVLLQLGKFPMNDYTIYADSLYALEHPDSEWSFLNSKLTRDSKAAIDSVKSDISKNADYGKEYYKQSPSKMSYSVTKEDLGNNTFATIIANPASRLNFNQDLNMYMRTYKPRKFSELDLPTPGLFENNNEFYKNLRLNYIKEHPELKLNPKNY